MKFDTIILDANSIINFMRYYHNFYVAYNPKTKKREYKIIFSDLMEFLVNKISQGEIIVLDKVYEELKSNDLKEFKEQIKPFIIDSLEVFEEVGELIEKYRIIENEKLIKNEDEINNILELYETTHADLFLIAYANKLNDEGKKVLLITEESFGKDGKLIPKIPVICKKDNEDIFCRNMPFALFDYYKEELEFSLKINENS